MLVQIVTRTGDQVKPCKWRLALEVRAGLSTFRMVFPMVLEGVENQRTGWHDLLQTCLWQDFGKTPKRDRYLRGAVLKFRFYFVVVAILS